MSKNLSKYFGALKATGDSPATGKVKGKTKIKSNDLSVTRGSSRKRLMEAYIAARGK